MHMLFDIWGGSKENSAPGLIRPFLGAYYRGDLSVAT